MFVCVCCANGNCDFGFECLCCLGWLVVGLCLIDLIVVLVGGLIVW